MDKQIRGRARGRTRLPSTQQQPGASAAQQPIPAAPPGQSPSRPGGAWSRGNPISGSQSQTVSSTTTQPQGVLKHEVAASDAGVASTRKLPAEAAAGDGHRHSGRGVYRGGRSLSELKLIDTRVTSTGKQGCSGRRVALQTNYFRLEKRMDCGLYQYRVDFAPEFDETKTKKMLFRIAMKDTTDVKAVFDGTVLYTPSRINPNPTELYVNSLNDDNVKVRITIRLVAEISHGDYQYIQIYNSIFRKCLGHLQLKRVGRDFYDPANKVAVHDLNMELWPGMITSIRQHERDILMCAEIKYKVMKNRTALDLIIECMNDTRGHGDWRDRFNDRILNTVVITEYNNRTYHIDDIDYKSTPQSTFKKKDHSQVTFANYYLENYGLTIRNLEQPLLVSKTKERDIRAGAPEIVKLVPELCRLTGLTEQERTNYKMMSQIAEFMRPTPQRRIKSLRLFNKRLQTTPKSEEELKFWNLKLSDDIIQLEGRQLPIQRLHFNGGEYSAGAKADWTTDMQSKPMFRNADLGQWVLIYAGSDEDNVKTFHKLMTDVARGMKWPMLEPVIQTIQRGTSQNYNEAIGKILAKHSKVRMFMIIIPKRTDIYNFIKIKLVVKVGIPSQLVTTNTIRKPILSLRSIATKVVVQMNTKLGGAPWAVPVVSGYMFCGFDVCHDPSNKSRSYGAFLASYDDHATAYYSTVAPHKDGAEVSSFLGLHMAKAIKFYMSKNKRLPKTIIFYRDGVGNGQLSYIVEREQKDIINSLEAIYRSENQKLVFRMILVNKRINTRFFLNGGNPEPGTVVDDVVTMPESTDFYLIPQCTRQGTVSPTYYSVLGPDSCQLSLDATQLMTYRMCHQYYNWSGTVRVPAPCQYAHKLAYQASQNLRAEPHQGLNHLLHFL